MALSITVLATTSNLQLHVHVFCKCKCTWWNPTRMTNFIIKQDMRKYGGPGRCKQKCRLRQCEVFVSCFSSCYYEKELSSVIFKNEPYIQSIFLLILKVHKYLITLVHAIFFWCWCSMYISLICVHNFYCGPWSYIGHIK